jgi:hypothetical protein
MKLPSLRTTIGWMGQPKPTSHKDALHRPLITGQCVVFTAYSTGARFFDLWFGVVVGETKTKVTVSAQQKFQIKPHEVCIVDTAAVEARLNGQ